MTIRQLIGEEELLNQPQAEAPEKEDYSEIIQAMTDLTNRILDNPVVVDEPITIANFDEVKLHLRQELTLALKPLVDAIKKLDKKPIEEVKVSNLKDIVIPEAKEFPAFPAFPDFPKETHLSQETLTEVRHLFMRLGDVIKKSLKVEVLPPNVVVNTPDQLPPVVNVNQQDLTPILAALAPLERFFNDDEEPIYVRFRNDDDWFDKLRDTLKESSRQMVGFAGGSSVMSVRNANATTINPATEETLQATAGLVTQPYDFISLSPPSLPTTITYKRGGASGTTVATLTIAYSGTDISTVTKS